MKNGNPYVIQDAFSNPSENWTYVLGICEDVPSAESNTEDRCASTTGSAYEVRLRVCLPACLPVCLILILGLASAHPIRLLCVVCGRP